MAGSGCGNSPSAPRRDAGTPADVPISSGDVAGSGGVAVVGGLGGSAAGGTVGTTLGGAGGFTGAGGIATSGFGGRDTTGTTAGGSGGGTVTGAGGARTGGTLASRDAGMGGVVSSGGSGTGDVVGGGGSGAGGRATGGIGGTGLGGTGGTTGAGGGGGATGSGGVGGTGGTAESSGVYGMTCTTTQNCPPDSICCDGSSVSCDGTRLPTGDGTNSGEFTVSEDGLTVTDTITGLTWQRDSSGTRDRCSGDVTAFDGGSGGLTCTWAEAKAYCAALTLGGVTGWRLPARHELRTIVDFTRTDPSIDPTAFPNTPAGYFWTSSPYAGLSGPAGNAWFVAFTYGYSGNSGANDTSRVRCVR
jgi:hypothetical protein